MAHRVNGTTSNGRSIGELVSDLLRQTSELVQEEITLARLEMSNKIPVFGRSIGMIAGGGALAYAGVFAILAAIIIALHAFLPWWAASLLVGVVAVAIGYVLIQGGLQTIKRTNLAPRRTIASLRGYQETARPTSSAFTPHS